MPPPPLTTQAIAGMIGAPAALVTSGCAGAMVMAAAAAMTGSDPRKIIQLPDTTGMPCEILIQSNQRYHYDRCWEMSGGKLVVQVALGDDGVTLLLDCHSTTASCGLPVTTASTFSAAATTTPTPTAASCAAYRLRRRARRAHRRGYDRCRSDGERAAVPVGDHQL